MVKQYLKIITECSLDLKTSLNVFYTFMVNENI